MSICKVKNTYKKHLQLKLGIVTILTIFNFQIFGQNYIEYQKVINRIDEDVLGKNYNIATKRLDSLYGNYSFVFARHCFKALQICCKSGDSTNADKWLRKSFIQGVPIWMVRKNELTKHVFNYSTTQTTIKQFDSLHNIYSSSINHDLRNKIDSLYEIDQQFTRKVNNGFFLFRHTFHGLRWLNNNNKQFEILNDLIDKYGYPGERIIGLPKSINDSTLLLSDFDFYGPDLRETKAFIMLIHYYSKPNPDLNIKLLENVKLGNMPPYQFGVINDFMAKWGKKKHGDYQYYNVWHIDPNEKNETEIEKRRNSIGLNRYEQQDRNMFIWRERRKNKTANSEIILE